MLVNKLESWTIMDEKLLEAQILAEIINVARAEGKVADSEHTVRLCELLDQITV